MKNIYFIILSIFFISKISLSQDMWVETNLPSQFNNLTTIKFQNELTGYIGGFVGSNIEIYKTTDSGLSWGTQPIWQQGATETYTMDFDFIDLGNGNLRFFISYDKKLVKYENSTNTTIYERDYKNEFNKVKVINNNTVYWLYTGYYGLAYYGGHYAMSIYRSTNGGINWTIPVLDSYSQQLETETIILSDINSSPTDPNKVAVSGYLKYHNENKSRYLYRYSSDNFENNGGNDGFLSSGSDNESFDKVSYRSDGQIIFLGSLGISKLNVSSNSLELIYDTQVSNPNFVRENGLSFIDNSTGYIALIDGHILKTTNGGYNWVSDGTIPAQGGNHPPGIISFEDVTYYATQFQKKMYSRKIGVNLSIKYDNTTSGTGTMSSLGTVYSVPSVALLRGGATTISTNKEINGNIFYKWNNNYLNYSNAFIPISSSGSTVEANYKTKKYSNSGTAINNSVQRRSFRDKFGSVNTIHESMGGIFFTKSTDNGNTFITEEVVNDNPNNPNSYATDNNINSFTSELIKPDFYQATISTEKTPVVCWERREGNTINIKVANRKRQPEPVTDYYWETNENASFQITGVTEQNFKAFPKVISILRGIAPYTNPLPPFETDTIYYNFYAIPYFKPDASGSKLMLHCVDEGSTPPIVEDFEITSGNVSDLSVVSVLSPTSQPYSLDIHMIYKKDNKIYYRKENVQYCSIGWGGDICYYPDSSPFEVSSTDGLTSRWTPDISLRNGNPVVVYRGARICSSYNPISG